MTNPRTGFTLSWDTAIRRARVFWLPGGFSTLPSAPCAGFAGGRFLVAVPPELFVRDAMAEN